MKTREKTGHDRGQNEDLTGRARFTEEDFETERMPVRGMNKTEAFQTFPLADDFTHTPGSNEAIPSPEDVKEAKDWVDFNEK